MATPLQALEQLRRSAQFNRVPTSFIDFSAFRRGQREAQADQLTDLLTEQSLAQNQIQQQSQLDELAEVQRNRTVSRFLSALPLARLQAAEAGQSSAEATANIIRQIQANPTFQGFDPETQGMIAEQLSGTAATTAQQAIAGGELAAAADLLQMTGQQPPAEISPAAQAFARGDISGTVAALEQQFGTDVAFDPASGTVELFQQRVPIDQAVGLFGPAGLAGGAAAAAEARALANAQQAQQQEQAQAQQRRSQEIQMAAAQFLLSNPDPQMQARGQAMVQALLQGQGVGTSLSALPAPPAETAPNQFSNVRSAANTTERFRPTTVRVSVNGN